jgi:hypothetical protein
MRVLVRCVLVALVPALGGCITSETLIRLNADRSGTFEQLILVHTKTLEELPRMMGDMLGGDVKSSSKPSAAPLDLLDGNRLRAEASEFGDGVRFVSVEKIARADMQGARVTYAFDDVNALTIDPEPPLNAMGGGAPKGRASDPIDLGLTTLPNGNTLLTVQFDQARASKNQATGTSGFTKNKGDVPPGMEEMIRQLFDGFRVAVDVEVTGPIVRTSSPWVAGSRVTVLEMDLGMLLADPGNLKVLDRLSPTAGLAEMMPVLRGIKGIKINESPLTIEFSGR